MHTLKTAFDNGRGQRLAAIIDRPVDDRPIATAILAHCFTCSKSYKAVRHISRALAAEGFAVLSFDFTGLGESEGEFVETSFSSNVDDLVAAAEFLEDSYGAPSVLIGHSLGGAAAIMAASRIAFVQRMTDGTKELFVIDSDGENIERITDRDDVVASPSWSPDGETIDAYLDAWANEEAGADNCTADIQPGEEAAEKVAEEAAAFGITDLLERRPERIVGPVVGLECLQARVELEASRAPLRERRRPGGFTP